MKVFITGATGYIGERLAARLLEDGCEVHALCRHRPENPVFRDSRFHFHQGDIQDYRSVASAMKGCTFVFHLAAAAKVWLRDPAQFYRVNVTGTINVLNAAVENEVQKVVFTSSAAVYGSSNGRTLEEDDTRHLNFFTDYESSKFIAEERIQHYARKGLHVVIVHPTKVYGPGILTESNALSQIIRRYVEGEWHIIPGNGRMIVNFSYIDDVVNGHLQALDKGKAGEKYILGGINASFNEFFQQLKRISNKRYVLFHLPRPCMMFYAWQEEMLGKLPGREPRITRPWIKKYDHHLALSSGKAERELGYTITSLERGLKHTLDWLSGDLNVYY